MSKTFTVNQGFLSLPTHYLEYGRHVARHHRRRRRRRTYAPTINTASHDNHEKIKLGFLLFPIYGLLMGLRLAALQAAGARLLMITTIIQLKHLVIKFI